MKDVHIIFGGNPDVYRELMYAFHMSFQELGYNTILHSLGRKYRCTTTGNFNIVVDAYRRVVPDKTKHNVLLHLENNEREDYDDWSKVLHISPIKICRGSVYFPFGYSPAFDYQYDMEGVDEDIDISFFGKITETRQNLLRNIQTDRHRVTFINLLGEERDRAIARSKINLTMKSAPDCVFEQVRANLILSKGKLLFAEDGYKGGFGFTEKFLIPFNKNNFSVMVDRYLDDNMRRKFTDYIKDEFKMNHTFTKYVREIVL